MSDGKAPPPRATLRIDKWLWQARFFKTRALAAAVVSEGRVRVNGTPISKPSRAVGPGDVLTFAQADTIRVIRMVAPGLRRGPATEAQGLYEDLDPPESRVAQDTGPQNPRYEGKGRPSARDRRNMRSEGVPGKSSPLE